VVAAAFTLMFVGFGAAYSFAAFFSAFQAEFGAPRGHVALVFSVAAFIWFAIGAPAGMLADRFGPRRVTLAGALLIAASLWLASRAQSVEMLYATYSIGLGVGVGLVYVPAVGAVQPWFEANRASASGMAVAGIGAGNFAGPLLADWLIRHYGWRGGYIALAACALLLGVSAALVIREKRSFVRGAPAGGTSLRDALRTREFPLIYAGMVFMCIGVFVPMVHLGPYAQDFGFTERQGVALVSLVGVGSLLGRFAIGPLADRLGRRLSMVVMYVGLGTLFLVWWAGGGNYWVLAVFAVGFGMLYGGCVALFPTIVMDLYGARAIAAIIGWLYTGAGIGTLLGPWLAGVAFDAFGTYEVPILAGAAFSFIGAVTILPLLKRAHLREKAPTFGRG
jgi:MFS family permease